jgi:hypothetical protein
MIAFKGRTQNGWAVASVVSTSWRLLKAVDVKDPRLFLKEVTKI